MNGGEKEMCIGYWWVSHRERENGKALTGLVWLRIRTSGELL
jgi:hypothetical protein